MTEPGELRSGQAAWPRTTPTHGWRRLADWAWLLIPLLAVLFYSPSFRFGLLWDDPTYYELGSGLSFWQLFGPVPTFQFYRPLALVYNRLFIDSAGLIHSAPRHVVQVLFHAANIALVIRLARTLGFDALASALAGLVLAVHPFAQQAVACQGSQQPMATLFILGAVLAGTRFLQDRRRLWLGLSLASFLLGLLAQESALAVVPLLMVMSLLHGRDSSLWRRHRWLVPHLVLALCYLAIWVATPRKGGVLGSTDLIKVAAYMGQALLPPTGWLASPEHDPRPMVWLLVAAGVAIGLVWAGWRRHRLATAAGATLYLAGIAPTVIGLSWAYASVGSRLAYPALPGVALLWAGALAALSGRRPRAALTVRLLVAAGLVAWLAISTLRLQRLYTVSTAHLQATVGELTRREERTVLVLNYPEQLALRRPPYALGYWGIILAPVVQELSDYAMVEVGHSAQALDLVRLDVGTQQWHDSPYRVDWRGQRVGPEDLLATNAGYDDVLVTTVSPQGELALEHAGWAQPAAEHPTIAVLGERLALREAGMTQPRPDRLDVTLTVERTATILPDDVLFVHLLDAGASLAAGADSDLWGGYLPLQAIPALTLVGDVRSVGLPTLAPGDYAVTVGLYNRATQERYDAVRPDGSQAWQGELQIGTLHID